MTLPLPPNSIDLDDVNVELPAKSSGDQVSLDDSALRGLTPNSTYADALHGTGINTSSGSIISIYELYGASALDTTPDQFTFTDATGSSLSTTNTSNTITISGMSSGASTAVSISGGSYSKNSGSYTTSAGTAQNGDTFSVQVTSSGSYNTTVNSTLTVGGVSDTYSVTTQTAPPAASYDSFTRSPTSINEDGSTNVTFTVNTTSVANGTTVGYTITGISASDISLSSLTGNITISSNSGSFSFYAIADSTTEGNETATVTLASTDSAGNSTGSLSTSVQINDTSQCPAAGTPVGSQYCVGYDLYQNYTNGSCGTYASLVQANSATCGYCPPANQPVGGQYCGTGADRYTRYQNYTDGSCGTYPVVVAYRSSACGYTSPSISISGFNNGAASNYSWNKVTNSTNSLTATSGTATASATVASGLTASYQWSLVSYSQGTGDATLTGSSFSSGQSSSTTGSITGYPNVVRTTTIGSITIYYCSESVSTTIRCTVTDSAGGTASADISNIISFYWQA